jgi:hypothetical protein
VGREALIEVEAGKEKGKAKVLLESTELILCGEVRRTFARASIKHLRAKDGVLQFTSEGETVRLHLGAKRAEVWATTIAKPPPGLKQKLGLDKGKARVIGTRDDVELEAALEGATVEDITSATILIARVDSEAQLKLALAIHANAPKLPLWTIYPKGKTSYGDAAIRTELRARGFRDTKSCAVSDKLTATRYNPA